MNAKIDLAVDVSNQRAAAYRAMASRSRSFQIVSDQQECRAVVTDSPEKRLDIVLRGGHMLVLDPLQISNDMRTVLASSGRTMPALSSRFQPSTWQIKRALDDGKLGQPGLLRIHHWRSASDENHADLASELDLAIWMIGSPPSEVYAVVREKYLHVHLGFAGGAMAIIDIDWSIPDGNTYDSLSLIGSTGAAYADDQHNMNLLLGAAGTSAMRTSQRDVALAGMMEEFAAAITDDRWFSPNWSDVEVALQLAEITRLSANEQRVLIVQSHHA